MVKKAFLLILLAVGCIAADDKSSNEEQMITCKSTCPSLPHFSRCQYKCDKQSVLDCKDSGLLSLSGAELEKWEKPLTNCKIEIFSLRLDSNSLERLTQIPNVPGLQSLSLKTNKMAEIEPKVFLYLTKLKELDLSENILTGEAVRPDIFIGPSKKDQYEPLPIEILHLSQNSIHSLNSKTFEHLPNLRQLYLHDNPLKVIDEHTITAIVSAPLLEVLSLSGCMLQKVSIPKESKLQRLFLNNNNISVVPQELPANLTYLNLNTNPIVTLPRCAFCHVPKLQDLSISGMANLTTIESEAFRGLPVLKTLSCEYNKKLEDISPAAFVDMGHNWTLRKVSFAWCSLKTLPRSLLPWSQIGTLDVRGNPLICDEDDWSPNAVELLRKSEKAFGLLAEQQSCNSWNLRISRHAVSLGMVVQTLFIAVSAAAAVVLALFLVILSVRKAQAERNISPHLMVHYRRATRNPYP